MILSNSNPVKLLFYLTFILFFEAHLGYAQEIIDKNQYQFQNSIITFSRLSIEKSKKNNIEGEIDFAIIGDLKNKKPILFLVEGSGNYSSFLINDSSKLNYIYPNGIFNFLDNYNIVIAGKFGIPLVRNVREIKDDYLYYDSTGNVPKEYLLNTNLETSVYFYKAIITEILKKSTKKEFVTIGHSQGARIALELANHKKAKACIYMSSDPLGRFASVLDSEFSSFENRNNERYDYYLDMVKNGNNDSLFRNETTLAWKSFTYPSIISMGKMKVPLLITYGDMDKSCPNCYIYDILPLHFTYIDVKKYKNLDHSYFDKNDLSHFDEVYSDILNWLIRKKIY